MELIIFMLFGFLLLKLGWIKKIHINGLSGLLTKLSLPCAILMSCQMPFSWQTAQIIGESAVISLLFMIVTLLLALLMPKIFRIKADLKNIWVGCCTFSNILFIGIPIIGSLYGHVGLIVLVTYNAFSNLFLFSLGIKLYSSVSKFEWRSFLLTPAIAASILGFLLFFARIRIVSPISDSLSDLGNMTAPLSMLITGALFAQTDFKHLFKRLDLYEFCLTRLVILPLVLVPLLKFGIQNQIILGVMVIAAAMPAGAINTALAELYSGQGRRASEYVVSSTLLSMLTIPLVAWVSLFA
ncbi:MAG: AEC family transporter [Oenococcus sp.]|uniref:AEC family transporter n=1 Tax=Oenococcus sp. TaxID=1979414 RepID=UPI0039EC24C5